MKIIFAGTPQFAATHLDALLKQNFDICAVFTQPDRPAGRGRQLTASPVKQLALQHQLSVHQPEKLDEAAQKTIAHYQADLMIVVAYGLLIPISVINMPQHGCINVHASLLPRWRGAAPIQHAILDGDNTTGITIMQIDEGLDSGDMLLKANCPIDRDDTSATLHEKLARLGADTLIDALHRFDSLRPEKQDETLVTYAKKIKKSEAIIDWQQSAVNIHQQIRAFNPWPVAQTQLDNTTLRVWSADLSENISNKPAGSILNVDKTGIHVATGDGTLILTTIQLPGKKAMPVSELLHAKGDWLKQHCAFH
ncbi:MAG: methionyl-tRNA formyltransferase [Legionellaceae bacterium]|nr:methionyl-tRNA formyltransferase [Legionellaceae bacterium]